MSTLAAHALTPSEVARALETDPAAGLTEADARARLERYGPNRPRAAHGPPYLRLALRELADPLVLLLIGAAAVSIAIGDTVEGAAIAAVIVVNGVLGFWQEVLAERAILALSETFTHHALVIRGGSIETIDAEDVVPGDVLLVDETERIAADARVVAARGLEVDESALTGESLPVAKQEEAVAPGAPLAERLSMVYAGSAVTRGRARAVVCATAGATELGQIEALAAAAKPPPTPLARRLAQLARQMVIVGIAITLALAAAMLARGEPWHEAFLVAVAVAVAAVPEGLAATVTAALALGARAMARRGAIVRRLEAIETLGETTVICTDKTGTLTENRIRVAALRPAASVDERGLLTAAVLASTARPGGGGLVGDPIEQALLLAAMERGLTHEDVLRGRQLTRELPFDSERRRMTIVYDEPGGSRAYMKGAPEVVAAHAAPDAGLEAAAAAWAGEGFRVLTVAARDVDHAEIDDVEDGHELLGVVALHDPLRETAASSVAAARRAGIEVRMVTGDHPATARTIGHALELADDAIVARATPADKLALVEDLQRAGHVVAVTGDGVNDAPALRRADVGVAMGRSGTEAAREAAALVLTDDDFATIVAAVEEGRRVGDNIRTFVAFLLSANLGEVLVFAIAIGAGLGVPLAVIQVLLVNLVTDGLPALALAREPARAHTMSPRQHAQRLFGRRAWLALAAIGLLVGGATLGAFGAGRAFGSGVAQTMAFATLALSELALVFGIRSTDVPAWRSPRNSWLAWSVAGSAALVAATVYVPPFHGPLATVALSPFEALVVLALTFVPLVAVELAKSVRRRRQRQQRSGRRA